MQDVTPLGTPTPSPSPSPTPFVGHQTITGGPITFGITGNLSVGTHLQSSVFGGGPGLPIVSPSPSSSPTPAAGFQQNVTSSNQSNGSIGMGVELTRRTATTITDVKMPLTLQSGGGSWGELAAIYSTPKYSVVYSAAQALIFGQFPLGGTLRGLSFIVPNGMGDQTLYTGQSEGANGEYLDLWGFRYRGVSGSNLFYEAGITQANGGPATGKTETLSGGLATILGNLSILGEGAWQERRGGDANPAGPGFAMRLDDGTFTSDVSATIRHIPAGFVGFGGGENFGDDYADLGYRSGSGSAGYFIDGNIERIGSTIPGQVSTNRVLSFDYNNSIGSTGGYGLSLQNQRISTNADPAETLTTNSAALTLSASTSFLSGVFGVQSQRQLSNLNGETSQMGYMANLIRNFGRYGFSIGGQYQRLTQDGLSPVQQIVESASLGRTFGRTSFNLGAQLAHTISSTSNAISVTPLLQVNRQISPALSLSGTIGVNQLHDSLNPSSNGHSRILSLSINSPFTYGNGPVTGRVDPRLPATIQGHVSFAPLTGAASDIGLGSVGGASGGVANVQIILDDRYLQRTDLTGGFQFSFVPPGQHQIRIDTATMPRGFTVDPPVMTLTLQGGQSVVAGFTVGNFGGILGKVYGLDRNGAELPLANVQVRLDGAGYSQTDTTGFYGFGHLSPGEHTVEVIQSSVPAFANFEPDKLTQKVSVANGRYSQLDFGAEPLGSISGKIIYAPDIKIEGDRSVQNAYVVAEPGEHAAIDDTDGSFIIDDLPPGDYNVSVDSETLQEGLGAGPESIPVHLGPGEHATGLLFTVGHFNKKVVFSFVGGGASAAVASVRVAEKRLPPGGTTDVTIDAPSTAQNVHASAFGATVPMSYDKTRKEWVGQIEVPDDAQAGSYEVQGAVASGVPPKPAKLTIDPKVPIATFQITPANAQPGQYVIVRARFLVDVKEGDKIEWEDGKTTVLGAPISGRVFTFNVLLSLRPLHGELLTKRGRLPIELM